MGQTRLDPESLSFSERTTLARELLAEGGAELNWLRVIKGSTPTRMAKRRRKAAALVALATGMLAVRTPDRAAAAVGPAFAAASANPFGLADTGDFASPDLADIDGDGDLDVFIGKGDGSTNVFRNTGSAAVAAFAAPSANPFGLADVGDFASPDLADIDGDGDLDAVIGDRLGNTFVFRNTGTATAPAFAARSTNPSGLADVGLNASPDLADIDGDGDLDAVIGEYDGNTNVFRNTGSATAPAFAAPSPPTLRPGRRRGLAHLPTSPTSTATATSTRSSASSTATPVLFRNTGSVTAPAFAAASTNPFGLGDVGSFATPDLADIDGDGDLDAVIGEATTATFSSSATLGGRATPPLSLRPPTLLAWPMPGIGPPPTSPTSTATATSTH